MEASLIAAAAVLGLIFGSFGTVVAYRLPRKEPMGGMERSRCPSCGTGLTVAENVPLVSFALQRGKCRRCGERIPARYPFTEAATAVLFALAAEKFGATLAGAAFAAFFWVLVVLTVIDIEHHLLPNRITYPAFVAGWIILAAAALTGGEPQRLRDAGLGALIFGGFLFVTAFVYPAGMALGDVKLAATLGTFLGYAGGAGAVLVGMFLSFLIGALGGILAATLTGGGRKMKIPFGPYLALGSVIGVFAGSALAHWYATLA